jgi:hypothetical protein
MLNIYISDQEQGLEALSKVISRQKEIAETIGSEVDLQNGKLVFCVMDHILPFSPILTSLYPDSSSVDCVAMGSRVTNIEQLKSLTTPFMKWVLFVKIKFIKVRKFPPFAGMRVFTPLHMLDVNLVNCFFSDVLNIHVTTVFCCSDYNMCGLFFTHFFEKHSKTEIQLC